MTKKFALYRSSSTLQGYVLVSSTRRAVDVFHHEGDGTWAPRHYTADAEMELESLDLRCPVAAFYDGLEI